MGKKGKPIKSNSSAALPPAVKKAKKDELKPGQFKCTLEQAPLVTVQLLAKIVNQNELLLGYFKRAEESNG